MLYGKNLPQLRLQDLKQVFNGWFDAKEREALGTYTLKLWAGDAGAGAVNLDGVTFP